MYRFLLISMSVSCSIYCFYLFFFFFKQKTAYEMRISDWSSDVCSSDLTKVTTRKGKAMSKVSIERITKIVRLIRRHGAVSMATFIAELEVSQASVKRDLEFLRDRLGCPLEWDRSRRGWVVRAELAGGGHVEFPWDGTGVVWGKGGV